MKRAFVKNLIVTGLVLATVSAPARIAIVKKDFVAHHGNCLSQMSEDDARDILRNNGIRTEGASSGEVVALGRTIQKINSLAGGRYTAIQGMFISFSGASGTSRNYARKAISMKVGGYGRGGNCGHLAHEIGHVVGNEALYSSYKSKVIPPCYVSNYADNNRNEEFAEAFAAFITNPRLLQNGSPSCKNAFNYFRKQFPAGNVSDCNGSTIIANTQNDKYIGDLSDLAPVDPVQASGDAAATVGGAYEAAGWVGMLGQASAMLLSAALSKPATLPPAAPLPTPVPPPPLAKPPGVPVR